MVADPLHVYLESLPSPVAKDCRGAFGGILGSRQVTEAYLLTLARRNHAIFVTFDTKLEGLGVSPTPPASGTAGRPRPTRRSAALRP